MEQVGSEQVGIDVVAGLLYAEGKVLACQRLATAKHGLKWEFPGGKVEAGEKAAEALARELTEELGIRARVGEEITQYVFAYPGKEPIRLIFFAVREWEGALENRQFAAMEWCAPEELGRLDFLEGDLPVLPLLARYAF